MTEKSLADGVVHELPEDLRQTILSHQGLADIWNGLTPLARNEWICWVISVKKTETRKEHMEQLCAGLMQGKRRPCCWPGCPHRNPKSTRYFKRMK